jgi:hypothetical protein
MFTVFGVEFCISYSCAWFLHAILKVNAGKVYFQAGYALVWTRNLSKAVKTSIIYLRFTSLSTKKLFQLSRFDRNRGGPDSHIYTHLPIRKIRLSERFAYLHIVGNENTTNKFLKARLHLQLLLRF